MTTVDHTQQQLQQDPISLTYTPTGRTRAHTYGHCYTSRTDPREARSQGVLVAERSATEFIEILYTSTTPMHSSHYNTPPQDHQSSNYWVLQSFFASQHFIT
jgi:hypothetical protein